MLQWLHFVDLLTVQGVVVLQRKEKEGILLGIFPDLFIHFVPYNPNCMPERTTIFHAFCFNLLVASSCHCLPEFLALRCEDISLGIFVSNMNL